VNHFFRLTDIKGQWPPCISVEELTLDGSFSSAPLENIRSLPSSVRVLYIDYVCLPVIYTALQKLGPELTKLGFCYYDQSDKTQIDLYKVLAACPKLESFQILSGRPVLSRDKSETALLPSDYFQNFQRYLIVLRVLHSLTDLSFYYLDSASQDMSLKKQASRRFYTYSACSCLAQLRRGNWRLLQIVISWMLCWMC
jgi:hypothetical protein